MTLMKKPIGLFLGPILVFLKPILTYFALFEKTFFDLSNYQYPQIWAKFELIRILLLYLFHRVNFIISVKPFR